VEPGLVVLDEACATKEEAIRLLVERMVRAGRAEDPLALEEAVWARERACATAVGHGFAVPHCRSGAASGSLALLRLREPLAWGGPEGEPVDLVVLLAMGTGEGGGEHLRVFARLARKLVDPAFRAALRGAPDVSRILALLREQVLAS
jgi:fructose-specific PTS system IIA-like component